MENRTLIIYLFFLMVWVPSWGQQTHSLGPEVQAYPAGVIFGLRGDHTLSTHFSANLRLGYNLARRRDLGKHDNERGGGLGGGLGTRYFFKKDFQGFFLGGRMDVWFLEIDWITEIPGNEALRGTTHITVLQPLAEAGYAFVLQDGLWTIAPKISLGYEINVRTQGEAVGEGAISLLGISLGRRF